MHLLHKEDHYSAYDLTEVKKLEWERFELKSTEENECMIQSRFQ